MHVTLIYCMWHSTFFTGGVHLGHSVTAAGTGDRLGCCGTSATTRLPCHDSMESSGTAANTGLKVQSFRRGKQTAPIVHQKKLQNIPYLTPKVVQGPLCHSWKRIHLSALFATNILTSSSILDPAGTGARSSHSATLLGVFSCWRSFQAFSYVQLILHGTRTHGGVGM